jgi:hypothetical protein
LKFYIHKRLLLPTLFFGIIAVFIFKEIQKEGASTDLYILLFFALLFVGIGLFFLWKNRSTASLKSKPKWDITVEISDNEIRFPNGYFFEQSPINNEKIISSVSITEINLHTFPPSVVVNDKEVVFVRHDQQEQLKEFAIKNNIQPTERFDIWEHLSQPFLDTEFEQYEKEKTIEELAKNGISPDETKSIRKKIGRFTYIASMEWIYLGHYNYLQSRDINKEKYWWANEIALRNYHKKQ